MAQHDVVVIGSYVQDHCWTTASFPAVGESRIGRFSTGPGGKGFNQAVACRKQGVSTLFLGAIGRDRLGETAQNFAREVDLAAQWDIRDEVPTAASSIVVNAKGENLIVVALGANDALSVEFIAKHKRAIRDARVLVCQLENHLPATHDAMAGVRDGKTTVVLNTAPINDKLGADLLAMADIITPNETEFAWLVERMGGDREAIAAAKAAGYLPDPLLHQLCRRINTPTVVITLGEHGCFVSHADPARHRDTEAFYRIPAERVDAVDTTGAGDAFTGGLAAGLVIYADKPLRRAAEHANRAAALSVEKLGTAPAMPTRAELQARFGG